MVVIADLSRLVTALGTFFVNPIADAAAAIPSFAGTLIGILFARIEAEFILMVFRINEQLAAIRNRGGCDGGRVARMERQRNPGRVVPLRSRLFFGSGPFARRARQIDPDRRGRSRGIVIRPSARQ